MPELDITQVATSNMTDRVEDYEVTLRSTDGVGQQKETEWINSNWTKWLGYYKSIPELKVAIDMRAIWTIGKGYEAEPEANVILDHVSGWGTDTFNSILKNMMVVKRIGGDSFCEIIRADDGTLINLKPLDPSSIKIIVDNKGIIKRYEQISKTKDMAPEKFKPSEILHLSNKRIADEIHGVSDIEAIEEIIKASQENFKDMKKVMHRFVKPMMKFIVDTDDESKIDALVVKFDAAVNKGENLYIPKGTVEHDLIAVPSNSTLNSSEWRGYLKDYFYQVVGIPQIILGNAADFGESSAKIAYLAFEQSVDDEQNDIEAQIWNQLGLRITLSFPASLRNEMLSDQSKDGSMQTSAFQPSDTTAGVGA